MACGGASARDCQYGQYWDPNTETCMAGGGQCPQGMMWNGQTCVAGGGQCPQGMTWNGQTCVAGASPQCPQGMMWNGQTCVAGGGQQCPQGTMWNGQACVASGGQQCPAGQTWNGQMCVPGGGFPGIGGGGCQPAGQLDPVSAQALQAAVMGYGQQQAQGASPVGGMISGNFQAGQCVEVQVTLNPGKCYTAVGLGAPGEEVDLQLAAPLPGAIPAPPFAQDQGTGNNAVLGANPNCFRAMFPTPAKFVLKVSAGQGPAGAQLYER